MDEKIVRLIIENNEMLKDICNRLGIPTRTVTGIRLTGTRLTEKVGELTELGYNRRQIADMTGVSMDTVSVHRRQYRKMKAKAEIDFEDDLIPDLEVDEDPRFADLLIDID